MVQAVHYSKSCQESRLPGNHIHHGIDLGLLVLGVMHDVPLKAIDNFLNILLSLTYFF